MIREAWSEVTSPHTKSFRVVVALVLAVLCAYLGFTAPQLQIARFTGFELLIQLLALGIFFVLFLKKIEYGVLGLILAAFFIRISLATGTASRVPASLVLAFVVLAVWLVDMLMRKRFRLYPSSTNVPLLLFVLVAILSMPWSWLFWRPDLFLWRSAQSSGTPFEIVQVAALSVMVMLPAVYLIALNVIRDPKWYKYIFIIVVGIGLPELIQRQTNIFPRLGGISLSGPGLYQLWLTGLVYAQVLFNDKLNKWLKLFFILLIGGWLYWTFVGRVSWLSGWVPMGVVLFVITWLKSKRLALLLALLALIPFILRFDYYYDRVIVSSQQEDFNRFWLWRTIVFDLTLSRADALLGTGPAGYAPYFQTYYPFQGMSAHNNYVDIIAQTGLLGFTFFVWFLLAVLKAGWDNTKKLTDPFLRSYNIGVLGAFVGMLSAMMLNDWFVPFAYNSTIGAYDWNVYSWILLGTMVGLKRFYPDAAPAPVPETSSPQGPSPGRTLPASVR